MRKNNRVNLMGGVTGSMFPCAQEFAKSFNLALQLNFFNTSQNDLDFGPIVQKVFRFSRLNSSVFSVENGQFSDLTSLRLIFQTGCVDPKHLINVPFLQIHDPANDNKVAGYVTFDLIKSLPQYH